MNISVVLNVYKRPHSLVPQIKAIKSQTVPPKEIFIWHNFGVDLPQINDSCVTISSCSSNLGVWARFAYALNCKSDYICIFDDDAIPGRKWFENCLNTLQSHNGLLGARGLRFKSNHQYTPNESFGWGCNNLNPEIVDIVGHSWFFHRSLLEAFWREIPCSELPSTAGEDIHFSWAIQKFLSLKTYVPPHPPSDLELWGSLPETGNQFGRDQNAISTNPNSINKFNKAYKHYIKKGFQVYYNTSSNIIDSPRVDIAFSSLPFIRKVVNYIPFVARVSRKIVYKLREYKIYI